MRFRPSGLLQSLALAAVSAGCRSVPADPPVAPPMVTDSAQYAVDSTHNLYRVTVPFRVVNTTRGMLSREHCNAPPQPKLEKKVRDSWVTAYVPIRLTCLSLPHFQIPSGAVFRGSLVVAAGKPGSRFFPKFEVESIPGVYRLRWYLHVGPVPSPQSTTIELFSNEFRLILR